MFVKSTSLSVSLLRFQLKLKSKESSKIAHYTWILIWISKIRRNSKLVLGKCFTNDP